MNYQKFFEQLPTLYENWGQESVDPKSDRFRTALAQVKGMTTPNVMQLLNYAVECLEPDEVYCEVGCSEGANLIGALLEHPEQMAYAVDDFSEFDPLGDIFNKLINNLSAFNLQDQVFVYEQNFEKFFLELQQNQIQDKIGLYFCDGAYDYRSKLMGLLLVRPFLAQQAFIISTFSSKQAVRQANWDFIASHPQCRLVLDLATENTKFSTAWNELQILLWDTNQSNDYDWAVLQQVRNPSLIQFISNFEIEREKIEKLYNEALARHQAGRFEEAEQKYLQILELNGGHADTWLYLGLIYYETKRYQEALQSLLKSLKLDSSKAIRHYSLGLALEKTGNTSEAIRAYQNTISLAHDYVDAYNNLGNLLAKTNQIELAESVYRQAIAANPTHFGAYINLGNIFWKRNQTEQAIDAYQNALKFKPNDAEIINNLISILANSGKTSEAIEIATKASILLPSDLSFKLRKHLTLPIIYKNSEEITQCRSRFIQGLDEIIQQISLTTPHAIDNALTSISYGTNFYVAYQGYNDLELQKQYGQFVHRIMAANYPQWVKPLSVPSLNQNGKIRVGYVSAYFQAHSAARWALGWVEHISKDNFETYCYYIGSKVDSVTQQFQIHSNVFHHIPENLEAVCQQIANDRLHILVFTDICIFPQTTQMAGLRLAPVQCTAWGHPMTSGSPTIDYYLSSDLMEPENAEEHYSEKLVRLPNLGFCYPTPKIPDVLKSRSDFHLRDNAVVYLSCQSLFKYLPQYDYIFPTLARRVPQSQFVFISHLQNHITDQFQQRLQSAFAAVGLDSEDYCVIVPRQDWIGYSNLNLASDVFLDTFSWSGGNTTLEALAYHLPVVTCPGEYMRGRHSYAILKIIGVTETIAQDASEYIEIAVRLGLDKQWRNVVVEKIEQGHSYLYDDRACIAALEAFYRNALQCT